MGDPVSKYGGKNFQGSKTSFVITVPRPNNEFESYMASATPQTGICKVTGLGVSHRNDRYGTDTISAYRTLRTALASRYGHYKEFDFIRSGALWMGVHEWTMAVRQKERTLTSFWDREEQSTLPNDVTSVMLDTKALDSSTSYVVISYEFSNIDRCQAVKDSSNDAGL